MKNFFQLLSLVNNTNFCSMKKWWDWLNAPLPEWNYLQVVAWQPQRNSKFPESVYEAKNFLLSIKRIGIKKSEAASFNALNVLLAIFFATENSNLALQTRLHLALGQIDLATQMWRNKSVARQQASWRTSEKESRGRRIVRLAAAMP